MKSLLFEKLLYSFLPLLISLFISMPASAAQGGGNLGSSKSIPVEVGLYKSTILSLNKKIALVTLASTKKQESESDYTVTYEKTSKEELTNDPDLLRKRAATNKTAGGQSNTNTNKFVSIDVLSPYELKLDGITIGSTSMIIWTKDDEDQGYTKTFYDLKVVASNREEIEGQIRDIAPNDEIVVQYANETVILSGMAAKEQTRAKAEKIAQAFAPRIINNIEISEPMQVLLQVKVAQVDKTSLKKLGISALMKGKTAEGFYNTVAAPSGGSSTSTSSSGGSSSSSGTGIAGAVPGLGGITPLDAFQLGVSYFPSGIGAVIQALVTKGHAKILAEPNLLVKSGQKGEFLAGSKIPYTVLLSTGGTATTTIVFQDVGIKLFFNPEVMENGLINLKIDPAEVSSISGTLAVNGYPIIDTRSVKTNVELREGESLIMAGLLQEDQIKTMSKIPLLGDIPILGALFRSSQTDLKEKELVFFVTPKIVKPLAPGTKTELPTDKKLSPEEERALQWVPTAN